MKKRTHLYVGRKNVLTWLMALCMLGSAVTRMGIVGMKGTDSSPEVWSQIVLPIAAVLLYALICIFDGKEHFYKTAIPVWMSCFYFGILVSRLGWGSLTTGAFWICLLFFALMYTVLTSAATRRAWLLVPMILSLAASIAYMRTVGLFAVYPWLEKWALPDFLMLVGWLLMVLGLQVHPAGEYHPTWGDRSDGRRLRSQSPVDQVSPYIMVTRNSANNLFEDSIEISRIERYIRQKRKEGLTGFGINHVLLSCYVRGIAKYPALNRFVSGQKVYSRGEDIQYCMTVKKEMSVDSPDTVIKVHLNPRDTADQVYEKFNAAVAEVKNAPLDSSLDKVAHIFTMIPGVVLKFAVWLLKTLDYFGLVPNFLLEVSPFHGSVYFTSMGSLGIPPVFHHLYDFGNLPIFAAFGCKYHKTELDADGNPVDRKYVDVKFNVDERIVDGYYYAAFFRYFKRLLAHPEQLDLPPETVETDID